MGLVHPSQTSPKDSFATRGILDPAGDALHSSYGPGTYDVTWIKSGYPARPADYKEQHENCAPEDLVFREPLRGGEVVRITGVNASGPPNFVLPKLRLVVEAAIDGTAIERRPHLDTVVVDSDAMVLELIWRALFRCPTKMGRRFTSIQVRAKEFLP